MICGFGRRSFFQLKSKFLYKSLLEFLFAVPWATLSGLLTEQRKERGPRESLKENFTVLPRVMPGLSQLGDKLCYKYAVVKTSVRLIDNKASRLVVYLSHHKVRLGLIYKFKWAC